MLFFCQFFWSILHFIYIIFFSWFLLSLFVYPTQTTLLLLYSWPLLIDPQLQGIKWLKTKEGNKEGGTLIILQMSMANWPRQLEGAIQNGYTVIIENLGQEVGFFFFLINFLSSFVYYRLP